jgi:hypothetical protein
MSFNSENSSYSHSFSVNSTTQRTMIVFQIYLFAVTFFLPVTIPLNVSQNTLFELSSKTQTNLADYCDILCFAIRGKRKTNWMSLGDQ